MDWLCSASVPVKRIAIMLKSLKMTSSNAQRKNISNLKWYLFIHILAYDCPKWYHLNFSSAAQFKSPDGSNCTQPIRA